VAVRCGEDPEDVFVRFGYKPGTGELGALLHDVSRCET
jgi:hypothetical protein